MACLALLNGAPGVGKSTVARALAARRPLLLVFDLDVVRTLLGPVPDLTDAYLATRELALAMADRHLRGGHDVVVPQFLGRPEFVDALAATTTAAGATFVHVVLDVPYEVGRVRFDARGDVPQLRGATDTHEEMADRLATLRRERPDHVVVDASGDRADVANRVERVVWEADPAGTP